MTDRRLHHIAVVVRSLDEAIHTYRAKLGLELNKVQTVEEQGVKAALLRMENVEVELLEPLSADSGIGRYLNRRGESLHHVCFTTPDIRAELAGLKAKGVDLLDQEPRNGLAGLICFLHPRAASGVLVELVEAAG